MINFGGLVKLIKLHLAGKLGPYEENPTFEELGYASLRELGGFADNGFVICLWKKDLFIVGRNTQEL